MCEFWTLVLEGLLGFGGHYFAELANRWHHNTRLQSFLQENDTALDNDITQMEAELLRMKGEADRLREMCEICLQHKIGELWFAWQHDGSCIGVRYWQLQPLQPSHFDRYNEDELQEHMSLLHEYNEIKDVGQLLLGKLGVCRTA